jgi:hypothetical protein
VRRSGLSSAVGWPSSDGGRRAGGVGRCHIVGQRWWSMAERQATQCDSGVPLHHRTVSNYGWREPAVGGGETGIVYINVIIVRLIMIT